MLSKTVFGLIGLLSFAAHGQPSAFAPGEHTVYEVRYLGIAAGVGDIRVGASMQRDGHDVWPLVCVGETRSLAAIFQVHDTFVSYWDPVSQTNVASDFVVDENRKRRREKYRYDRAAAKVFAVKQREGHEAANQEFDIQADAVDLAAASFWLRNVPLALGGQHEKAVFTGMKQFVMHATVEGKESITTPMGAMEVWKVSMNADFKGNVATRGNIHVYYTADAKQLPVRAEANFVIGSVVAEVVQYEPGHAVTTGAPR